MPDPWATWDALVAKSGRPERIAEELNDLELLILLTHDSPRRSSEKLLLRQEAYRRMGHRDATPPHKLFEDEPRRATTRPESFSELPKPGDRIDPF